MIGTRRPTPLGLEVARRITTFLVSMGYAIVSGLARGIDTAAHQATVDARGVGIAVLAEGLDRIYPKENRQLTETLVERGGALVSEYPLGTRAQRGYFVERDRLQSALSVAVMPIQTNIDGGTMHTVRFAEAQGRLVVCPAPLRKESSNPQYRGIHELIRTSRAWSFERGDYQELGRRLKDHLTSQRQHLVADDGRLKPPSLPLDDSDLIAQRTRVDKSRRKDCNVATIGWRFL